MQSQTTSEVVNAVLEKVSATEESTVYQGPDKRAYLRVKVKSLAVEARIIRADIRKYNRRYSARQHDADKAILGGMMSHLRQDVSPEARASQIAAAYLRGKAYATVEPTAKKEPDWKRVTTNVKTFGTYQQVTAFDAWLKDAQLRFIE